MIVLDLINLKLIFKQVHITLFQTILGYIMWNIIEIQDIFSNAKPIIFKYDFILLKLKKSICVNISIDNGLHGETILMLGGSIRHLF